MYDETHPLQNKTFKGGKQVTGQNKPYQNISKVILDILSRFEEHRNEIKENFLSYNYCEELFVFH